MLKYIDRINHEQYRELFKKENKSPVINTIKCTKENGKDFYVLCLKGYEEEATTETCCFCKQKYKIWESHSCKEKICSCGNKVKYDYKYCPFCGVKLDA